MEWKIFVLLFGIEIVYFVWKTVRFTWLAGGNCWKMAKMFEIEMKINSFAMEMVFPFDLHRKLFMTIEDVFLSVFFYAKDQE